MLAQTFAKILEILDCHQVKGKNSQSDIHPDSPSIQRAPMGSRILLGLVSLVEFGNNQIRCLLCKLDVGLCQFLCNAWK